MDITIVKIAGAVITKKESKKPKTNNSNIRAIAKILKDFNSPYVLVHGSGSFGHPLAKKTGVDKTVISQEQLLAFAQIQELQNRLNYIFCDALMGSGIPAFPAQASSHTILERGRLAKMETEALFGLIKLNMVPVVYGVPAFDRIWGSAILSYDQIATYIAKQLKAIRIIEVEDVEGIFTANPKTNKNAELIPLINEKNCQEVRNCLSGSTAPDVTGGMKQKYIELLDAAKNGIVCQIVDLKHFKAALENQPCGTIINLQK